MSGPDHEGSVAGPQEVDFLVIQLLCVMLPLLMAIAISVDHFA